MNLYSTHRAETRLAFALTVAMITTTGLSAQVAGQKTFASSKDAVNAFIAAVESGNSADLLAILGPGSESVVSSGDAVEDKAVRDNFIEKYKAKHALVGAGEHTFTLIVGTDSFPLAVPLVDNAGKWYFDGAAGKQEILYRRIGRNELATIDVCKSIVAAQHDYAATSHDGNPAGTYAQRVVSTPGKQDGLYWDAKFGEPSSPAGPLLADASSEGYSKVSRTDPYHGYYFHMIRNPGGFAFLAYPAQYRNSGVMTFVVSQKGVVYQKDLGPNTADIAGHIEEFKIDNTWKPVK
jgi:Protein of unknown function (DUF2950)